MRPRSLGCLTVGVVLLSAALASQVLQPPQGAAQPGPVAPRMQMPPRDGAGALAPTGTGRIRGRVVASDNGNPLRRAQVRVSAPELRVNRAATTDAEGRYEVANLPQGRYSITVSRNGYVSLQFGQQRPFEPGRPLDLADGQVAEKIDFALPRGPMIDRPTGSPSTVAPGRLTCGWPACPPWAQRQVMRSRSGSSTDSGWPTSGAGNGVVGRQRIVPGGNS